MYNQATQTVAQRPQQAFFITCNIDVIIVKKPGRILFLNPGDELNNSEELASGLAWSSATPNLYPTATWRLAATHYAIDSISHSHGSFPHLHRSENQVRISIKQVA